MKRAMVSLATLALLAGMPAAWLRAQEPAAPTASSGPMDNAAMSGAYPAYADPAAMGGYAMPEQGYAAPPQGFFGHGIGGCLHGMGGGGAPHEPRGFYVPGTFSADAIFFNRALNTSQVLAVEIPNQTEALNIRDVCPDQGTATRLTALFRPGGTDIEVVFFNVDNLARRKNISTVFTAFTVPAISPTGLFNDVTADYTSTIYNGEINFRKQIYDSFAGFIGFRYDHLDEKLSLVGNDFITPGIGYVDSNVVNDLYGFQMGGNLSVGKGYSPFFIDLVGKAGVFSNQIHRSRANLDPAAGTMTYTVGDAARVSFVGELGMRGTYQVTSSLAVYGGYEVLFLSGVALAPDHVMAGVTTIDATRTAFYHGAFVGLEASW